MRARIPPCATAESGRLANGVGYEGGPSPTRREGGSSRPTANACEGSQRPREPNTVAAPEARPPADSVLRAAAQARELTLQKGDSDTEPDSDAQPAGAGHKGAGPPLRVGKGSKIRDLIDGGGLCSPGRWPPRARQRCSDGAIIAIRAELQRQIVRLQSTAGRTCAQLFQAAAGGQLQESPFPSAVVDSIREYMHDQLRDSYGDFTSKPREGDVDQPIRVRLLQALMGRAQDPDLGSMDRLAVGVPLGVDVKLPRTPAVYPRKVKWSLAQQCDPMAWDRPWGQGIWRDNYASTRGHEAEIARQQSEHVDKGLAEELTEAEVRRRWPTASIASLGALEKTDANGSVSVRLLFDATTGVDLNARIRVRDQEQTPGAPDIKRYQREQARELFPTLGLTVDVRDAHRTVQIRQADWKHQLCRSRPGGAVTMYRCGVFGVASISYWWSRLATGLQRTLLYLADPDHALWILRVADDFKLESTSERPQEAICFALLLLQVLGLPIQWLKLRGGREVEWVGYHLRLDSHELGLSESRAKWVVAWCRRLVLDGAVNVDEMREGLGRLAFVAGALEFERPFLAPLYSFVSRHAGCKLKVLPVYALLALDFLAQRIALRRHYPSAVQHSKVEHGPRVDARAEGSTIGIGGWLPIADESGRLSKAKSPRFMLELNQASAPWAFLRKGQPFRTIAALEAHGTLIGAKFLLGNTSPNARALLTLPSFTDNKGNSAALSRLATTKFPLCCIAMELSVLLESRGMQLNLEWTPRELNVEADRLSNGDSQGFDPALRVAIDPFNMQWAILDRLLADGAAYERQREITTINVNGRRKAAKRAKELRLKARDPW